MPAGFEKFHNFKQAGDHELLCRSQFRQPQLGMTTCCVVIQDLHHRQNPCARLLVFIRPKALYQRYSHRKEVGRPSRQWNFLCGRTRPAHAEMQELCGAPFFFNEILKWLPPFLLRTGKPLPQWGRLRWNLLFHLESAFLGPLWLFHHALSHVPRSPFSRSFVFPLPPLAFPFPPPSGR